MQKPIALFIGISTCFIWLPALVLISLYLREFPIFCQNRVGKDGQLFKIYKIKTISKNGKTVRLLRKSRIDEILQFINILDGTMNFFGYRPLISEEFIKLEMNDSRKKYILAEKPGIFSYGPLRSTKEDQHRNYYRDCRKTRYMVHRGKAFVIIAKTIVLLISGVSDKNLITQ